MFKITLLTVLIACASAVDVKSFLQEDSEMVDMPNFAGGLNFPECNFTFPPPPGGRPPGNISIPICVCPLSNLTGLPPLGQA